MTMQPADHSRDTSDRDLLTAFQAWTIRPRAVVSYDPTTDVLEVKFLVRPSDNFLYGGVGSDISPTARLATSFVHVADRLVWMTGLRLQRASHWVDHPETAESEQAAFLLGPMLTRIVVDTLRARCSADFTVLLICEEEVAAGQEASEVNTLRQAWAEAYWS